MLLFTETEDCAESEVIFIGKLQYSHVRNSPQSQQIFFTSGFLLNELIRRSAKQNTLLRVFVFGWFVTRELNYNVEFHISNKTVKWKCYLSSCLFSQISRSIFSRRLNLTTVTLFCSDTYQEYFCILVRWINSAKVSFSHEPDLFYQEVQLYTICIMLQSISTKNSQSLNLEMQHEDLLKTYWNI